MPNAQVAIYARVSSQQQAEAQTIASQVAALRERVAADGLVMLPEMEFSDDGYSGVSLLRPALEGLRDRVAAGGVDVLYVHAPDRLARRYAVQVLLLDEFQQAGVEVVFLNRALGQSPEDHWLLQMQGMFAEYERAKIVERCRRGWRHAAQQGAISVLSPTPYGYRYICKQDGNGEARFAIVPEQAGVVQPAFTWVGIERASLGQVSRRLTQFGVPTHSGKPTWNRSAVWSILTNPAYRGEAAFGRRQIGPPKPRLRVARGRSPHPRRSYSVHLRPASDWIRIAVPALVSAQRSEAVQAQPQENERVAPAKASAGHTTRCRGCSTAPSVGTPSWARAYARTRPRVRPASMTTTVPPAGTLTALAARRYVTIRPCGVTCWSRPYGKKCAASCRPRSVWPANMNDACSRLSRPTGPAVGPS
jgi:site-specific DNA recombinase